MRYIRRLVHDILEIYIIALLAATLPDKWAARLIWQGARFYWFHPDAHIAEAAAKECWPNQSLDYRQLRWTYLFEASTAWRILMGRKLSMELLGQWPDTPGFVAAGGHYGNGIAVLWSLHQAGLKPRFILRPPEKKLLTHRPPLYVWSLIRFRLVKRLCPDGIVLTGGARTAIEKILDQAQTTPVILFDTPAPPGHSNWTLELGTSTVSLYTGAACMVENKIDQTSNEVVFFLSEIEPQTCTTRLRIESLDSGDWRQSFTRELGNAIEKKPEQWQNWPFIRPYLRATQQS